jgi:hypothetical protein
MLQVVTAFNSCSQLDFVNCYMAEVAYRPTSEVGEREPSYELFSNSGNPGKHVTVVTIEPFKISGTGN